MQQTSLQGIFDQIQKIKKEMKDIRGAYKDALAGSAEYKNINEKIKELRGRKKQIEQSVKNDFSSELAKLDDLKVDLESDQTMLSDKAFSMIIKGETVKVVDNFNNEYEPLFITKFKKA